MLSHGVQPWELLFEVIFLKYTNEKWGCILTHVLVFFLGILVVLAPVSMSRNQGTGKLEALENLIQTRFIGDVDTAAMEDAAADAMVNALGDRWSYYLSAQDYQTHQETMNNAYVGIGITILASTDGSGFPIQAVTEGSGAAEAGLLAEDLVIAVAGQDVRAMDTGTLRTLVRSEEGSFVDVTVLRGSTELTFCVERRRYETPVATGTLLSDKVGLVTIENFDTRCAQETIAAIEDLIAQGAEKFIFDVRNNPGGYAHELIDVLDYLLPEGEIFHTQYYNGQEEISQSDAACLGLPMAVLVNGDSYSAAEFFAAALQEYEAATVVGTQTCGKGYFQQTYELTDGSAVGLSVGKYYTPKGENLAGIGITPDILVELDEESDLELLYDRLAPEEDAQIQAALSALK